MKDQQQLEDLQQERDNALSELEDQKEQSRLHELKIEDQQAKISQLESTISRARVAIPSKMSSNSYYSNIIYDYYSNF